MKPLVRGDYVLATKYADGDPCDHFYVGFFSEMLCDRFLVDNGKGQLARANGFRRCERISQRVGTALCAAMPIIGDVRGKSVWWWRRHVKALEQLVSANAADEVRRDSDVNSTALLAAADYHRKECLRHEVAQKIGRTFPPGNHADWEQFHRAIWYACENAANNMLTVSGDRKGGSNP